MQTPTKPTPPSTSDAAFVPLRGESGRLFGVLDTRTGVIHVRKGAAIDRVQLPAYVALAQEKG